MMLMGAIGAVMGTALHQFLGLEVALAIIMGGLFGLFTCGFMYQNIIQTRRSAELELTFLLLD